MEAEAEDWGKWEGCEHESFSGDPDAGGGGDCAVAGMEDSHGAVCMDGVWIGGGGAGAGGVAPDAEGGPAAGVSCQHFPCGQLARQRRVLTDAAAGRWDQARGGKRWGSQ